MSPTHHFQHRLQAFAQRRPHRLQCKGRLVALQYLDQFEKLPPAGTVLGQLVAVQQQRRIRQVDQQPQQHVGQFAADVEAAAGAVAVHHHQHGQKIGLDDLAAADVATILVRVAVTTQNPDQMLRGSGSGTTNL